jgi:prepilin-type N-terminal cleavage/methylation domain-containing protein
MLFKINSYFRVNLDTFNIFDCFLTLILYNKIIFRIKLKKKIIEMEVKYNIKHGFTVLEVIVVIVIISILVVAAIPNK